MAFVTKKCYYSNISKAILFDFYSSYKKSCQSVQKGEKCHKVKPVKKCHTITEEKKVYRRRRPMCSWPKFPKSTKC